ncbi:hypothetical protein ABPG74_014845 [Tetrahymena malaccensis]
MTLETLENKAQEFLKKKTEPTHSSNTFQYQIHKKKHQYVENNNKKPEKQIKLVNQRHLYYDDINTDLTPQEIVHLIKYKADNDQNFCPEQLDDYNFKITQIKDAIDFDYDEETDEIIEVKIQQKSQYYLQIQKLSNLENMYTVQFQNITKEFDIEFHNNKNDFLEYLKKF